MTALTKSLGDLVGIAVACWFMLSADFADLPYKRILDAVAFFVALLSAARILRRMQGAP